MIKNCFNYVGSKDRILPVIDANLDKSKKILIDLFCGSGIVGINEISNYDRVVLNDACWQVMETIKFFRDNPFKRVLGKIDDCISQYKLSMTNKEGYLKLREDYNENFYHELSFDPAMFYCLLTHSFNYNIHISSKGKFNVPAGTNRSHFNKTLKMKLEAFQWELHENKDKITLKIKDFAEVVENAEKIIPNSTFYVDPPYLISDSAYGRVAYLGRWDEDKERKLYEKLDLIHEKGGTFLLSNVLENNGNYNIILGRWSRKYNVVKVGTDFTNCNYQRKNAGKTREILVRNY